MCKNVKPICRCSVYKCKAVVRTVRQGEGVQDVPWGGLPGDGTPNTRNSLSLSVFFSRSLCLPCCFGLSLALSLSPAVSFSLWLSLPAVSISLSLSLSLLLSLSLSGFLALSVSPTVYLSRSLFVFPANSFSPITFKHESRGGARGVAGRR